MKWFRLYSSVLNDPKVQQLSPELFKHWINILCVASEHEPRGHLPPLKDLAFALRLKPVRCRKIVESLCEVGILEPVPLSENMSEMDTARTVEVQRTYSERTLRVHSWDSRQRDSDNVAARVEKHRRRNNPASDTGAIRNVTLHETLLKRTVDTDTEKETEEETLHSSGKGFSKITAAAEHGEGSTISAREAKATTAAAAAVSSHHLQEPQEQPQPQHQQHHSTGNHWDDMSAKRAADEVARKVRMPSRETEALMDYIKACPHLSYELVIAEGRSFADWLNKNHKGATARVFYNRWLKPRNDELLQGKSLNGYGHEQHHTNTSTTANTNTVGSAESIGATDEKPKSDADILYEFHLKEARAKMVS